MSGRVPGLPERQRRDVKGLLPAGEPASWFSPTMLRLCSPCPAPPPPPASQQLTEPEPGPPAKAAAEERITDGAEARCACEAGSQQETARQAASETGGGRRRRGMPGTGPLAGTEPGRPALRTSLVTRLHRGKCTAAGHVLQQSWTPPRAGHAGLRDRRPGTWRWPLAPALREIALPRGTGSCRARFWGSRSRARGAPSCPRHEVHLALLLRRVCTVTGVCLELSSDFVAR